MGAYVYRLRGTKAFEYHNIDGKQEKVYDYVYWYKPYYCGMFDKEPSWMKPIHMLGARMEKAFKKIEPVKWVRHVDSKGEKADEIQEWGGGFSVSDYNERFQNARRIKLEVPQYS
jgi:hypothetical protein